MICGAYEVYGAVLFYCRYDLVSSGMGWGGVRGTFFFCFDSFIYNPLHAARRAMAAAGFSKITFSYPEPACAVIVRCP